MADAVARLRGRIAEIGVKHHVVAEEVGMHYTQLSRILNERQPMPKGFEGRVHTALDRLEAAEQAEADGVEACREIMENAPDTRVIMLTASTEEDAVIEAVSAGATGYLQKVSGMDRLLSTLKVVAAGEMPVPTEVVPSGLRQDTGRRETGLRPCRPDTEGTGDTCAVLPGHVIRRDC